MGRYSDAAKRARDLTNKQLGADIASFSKFTSDDIGKLLPAAKDKQAFLALMAEVEKETSIDDKLNFLRNNIETAGKAALQVLKFFV